jgi:hypothetical protein
MPLFDFSLITQQVLNSFVKNQVKQKGAPSLASNVNKTKPGSKPKTADGIDMGFQVDDGVIPVVYGHIGLSNTQFDVGTRPSTENSDYTIQKVRFPVSEGPIFGIAHRGYPTRDQSDFQLVARATGYSEYHFEEILLNDSFIKPTSTTYNYEDIKYSLTVGDGTTDVFQEGMIGLVTTTTAELEDTQNLNDLGDVEADIGVDYVLYWNDEASRWEAKSFSGLLQNAFDTRNSTGDSSDNGTGGDAGDKPTGSDAITKSEGIKYTQWNPPPHELCIVGADVGDTTTTLEYTDPPKLTAEVVSGKGAALQNLDCPTPYFSTVIDFKGVNECIDAIDVTTLFPEGIYREVTSTTHLNNEEGRMVLRDTTRPIENAGNLLCLEPNIEIVESGKGYTATVQTRDTGSVQVYAVFTTVVCGREFVLTEESYTVSGRHLGAWYHTKRFQLDQMNAGRGAITEGDAAGTQQIGAIEDPADCNANEVEHYDFSHYTLKDYLEVYPNQILREANQIKCYVWMDNKNSSDEYTISTDTYLHEIEICEDMGVFSCDYHVAELNRAGYILQQPDHNWKWQNYKHDHWQRVNSTLPDGRCYADLTNGFFSTTGGPDPLPLYDYFPAGGTTVGDVVFPPGESIPYACMKNNGFYSEGSTTNVSETLPAWNVSYADDSETLDVTITVDQGTLEIAQGPGTVAGQRTDTLILAGTLPNMQAALSTVSFFFDSSVTGDVNITTTISAPNGRSHSCEQIIRSQLSTPTSVKAPDTTGLTSNFLPAAAFSNTLNEPKVAWFQLEYRPKQADGDTTLSEIGLFVGGRIIQEPTLLTFDDWKNAEYKSTPGYSANPAWVIFDYLTDDCFGLKKEIIDPLTPEQRDVLYRDIYCAGQWCRYQPHGQGINDPRVARFNGVFYGAESKYEAIQKIADSFHGKFIYINGNPRLIWDGQGHLDLGIECGNFNVSKLVNQANSANTSYSSGSLGNVFNVVKVKYNDPFNYYKISEVEYRNEASIADHGPRTTTVELVGCTRNQQALWYGAWIYETEVANSDMISYTAGWDHYDVQPGDFIFVNDTLRPDLLTIGGRASNTLNANELQLDRDYTGQIAVTNSLGEIVEATATNGLATVPAGTYVNGCVWNSYSGDLKPNYKVIAIEESEDGVFGVTAQKHDPDKYTRIWANLI